MLQVFNESSLGAGASSSTSAANSSSNIRHHHSPQLHTTSSSSPSWTSLLTSHHATAAAAASVGAKIDKKHFDKINKLSDKLLKQCQSERMNLINSPPYIIDILPDICQVFNTIYVVYENKLHILNEIDYFCLLIKNCLDKFQQLLDLFKSAGKRMYDVESAERQQLTKYTLTFSHMLAEMKSLFPKDVYEGQNYRITKKDAGDFWKSNFQDRIIVNWKEFENKLKRVHHINENEVDSLRDTIQLTRSKYVSIFEFDVFTRLFQPWNNLLDNWKVLVINHPGYMAYSTYDEVHKRLLNHIKKPGSFVYRLSCTKLGQWAIGYVTSDHKILQTIPQSLVQALIDGEKQGLYLYPDGKLDTCIDISSAIAVTSASRIQISREQHEQYSLIGSLFQICKICSENNKNRKLEPCGHLICSSCLESWQEIKAVASCPFCRCEIKAFEPIIISPFEEARNNLASRALPQIPTTSNGTGSSSSLLSAAANKNLKSILLNNSSSNESINSNGVQTEEVFKSNGHSTLTSLSSSDLKPKTNNKPTEFNETYDEENYLLPVKDESESKYNLDLVLAENKSLIVTNVIKSTSSKTSLNPTDHVTSSTSKLNTESPKLLAPSFPPPLPPPPSSLVSVPNLPPLPALPSSISPPLQHPIVSVDASNGFPKNSIRMRIDNEPLFDQMITQLGTDRHRLACALLLCNNDLKAARNLLSSLRL